MPVREVHVADHFDALLPMMRDNWAETGFDFEFKPSKERYVMLQDAGVLMALLAESDGEPVGYCTSIIIAHPFNLAVTYCGTDAFYVRPSHRNGILPGRLVKTTERKAKARGASMISWHTRAGTPMAEIMLAHGYKQGDLVVHKEL